LINSAASGSSLANPDEEKPSRQQNKSPTWARLREEKKFIKAILGQKSKALIF
jgi:hypothetical protein